LSLDALQLTLTLEAVAPVGWKLPGTDGAVVSLLGAGVAAGRSATSWPIVLRWTALESAICSPDAPALACIMSAPAEFTALEVALVETSYCSTIELGGEVLPLPSLPKTATTAAPVTLVVRDGAEIHCVLSLNRPLCALTGADASTPAYARIAPAAYRDFAKLHLYEEGSSAPATRT
jgi:hypothetical protein